MSAENLPSQNSEGRRYPNLKFVRTLLLPFATFFAGFHFLGSLLFPKKVLKADKFAV